jgi:hypothetical protein
MLAMTDPDRNRVVTITASGTVTKEDYDRLLPQLERRLDAHGRLRFLIDIVEVSGFRFGALWEDLKFDLRQQSQFGRTAIIGDRKWQDWATRISSRFYDAEMRYFDANEAEQARAWVSG